MQRALNAGIPGVSIVRFRQCHQGVERAVLESDAVIPHSISTIHDQSVDVRTAFTLSPKIAYRAGDPMVVLIDGLQGAIPGWPSRYDWPLDRQCNGIQVLFR